MARRMKIDSVVGSYLDPLADKVKSFDLLCVFLAHCGCSLTVFRV